ncbi:MAG: hypothetical protein HWD61_02415 [Parachlamydiaceae bacterium]|nr:MAG: hypothetical protein HWD61_02415 [Parachlamydiaceae bacterium]
MTQETRFKQHDYDYTDYSEEDIRKLLDAMNCCAFPKLALILAEKYRLDLHEACKQINAAGNKIDPNNIPATLTLEEVLKYR